MLTIYWDIHLGKIHSTEVLPCKTSRILVTMSRYTSCFEENRNHVMDSMLHMNRQSIQKWLVNLDRCQSAQKKARVKPRLYHRQKPRSPKMSQVQTFLISPKKYAYSIKKLKTVFFLQSSQAMCSNKSPAIASFWSGNSLFQNIHYRHDLTKGGLWTNCRLFCQNKLATS